MTQGEMLKIKEVIYRCVEIRDDADFLIHEIERVLGVKQDASRPGYKGVLA